LGEAHYEATRQGWDDYFIVMDEFQNKAGYFFIAAASAFKYYNYVSFHYS